MRYFERPPLYPAIQEQLLAKTSTVFVLSKRQRREIVKQLMASQKSLCCYCESRIFVKIPDTLPRFYHIDHFEEQKDAPTRVFDYSNMLLSCQSNTISTIESMFDDEQISPTSCGHGKSRDRHKDVKIDYDLLLNPTKNVSTLFSYFDGVVDASRTSTSEQVPQVKYTIKRLNLDAYRLENARINIITAIQVQLNGLTDEQQKTFIHSLLDETQDVLNPYFSTIKDNFGFMLL